MFSDRNANELTEGSVSNYLLVVQVCQPIRFIDLDFNYLSL